MKPNSGPTKQKHLGMNPVVLLHMFHSYGVKMLGMRELTIREMSEGTKGLLAPSALFRTLINMQRDGLVTTRKEKKNPWEKPTTMYSVTPKGEEAYKEWAERVQRIGPLP